MAFTFLGYGKYENDTNAAQTISYGVKFTKGTNHVWKYEGGFKLSAEMNLGLTVGIPDVLSIQGGLSFRAETSHTWTNEETTIESEEVTFKVPVEAPPHTEVESKTQLKAQKLVVPYKMLIVFPLSGKKCVSRGKWVGVSTYGYDTKTTEKNLKQTAGTSRWTPRGIWGSVFGVRDSAA